jgi:hypothetical protein
VGGDKCMELVGCGVVEYKLTSTVRALKITQEFLGTLDLTV